MGEQSNTSVFYDDALVFKALRRIRPGIALDCEVGAFLTTRARFPHVPPLAGAIEYVPATGPVTTLGVLQGFTSNRGDGWTWLVTHLKTLTPETVDEGSESVFRELRGLGAITGDLHRALAGDPADPDFAPEPITAADASAWSARVAADVRHTCELVRARLPTLAPELAAGARALLASEAELLARARDLERLGGEGCVKIRVHGDYHLGQTLRTDGGFVVLDFEGEPARAVADGRRKQCALVDVAGMLRSFDYAMQATLAPSGVSPEASERWVGRAVGAFLDGYRDAVARSPVPLLPASPAGLARALSAFELDKALYEVRYELDNRPAWLAVPLRGLGRLLTRARTGS
jgi:maltose alpha-D-glucosyltransferase/alpha-amylase